MKRYMTMAAAALACAELSAQKINPTIEVTGTYEGKIVEIQKPEEKMDVPDSVLRFDLDFDYSVFANPYKGAYDFEPYAVNMKPQAMPYERRRFYLRAGAGYTLHPEAEAEYRAVSASGRWDARLYVQHHSYFGDYHHIAAQEDGTLAGDGTYIGGRDALSRMGVHADYVWKSGELSVEGAYRNLLTKSFREDRRMNGADAGVRVRSVREKGFLYDFSLAYSVSDDRIPSAEKEELVEDRIVCKGAFGPSLGADARLVAGFDAEYVRYSNAFKASAGRVSLSPGYQFGRDGIEVRLGAKVSALTHKGDTPVNTRKTQWIYPDVHVTVSIVPERLALYGSATGGNDLHAYSAVVSQNHFFSYTCPHPGPLLIDNTVERFHVAGGFRGNVASRFYGDLTAGYAVCAGGLFEGISVSGESLLPAAVYADCKRIYGRFAWRWQSKNVRAEGKVMYQDARLSGDESRFAVAPAKLTADLRVQYDWRGRIRAGVTAEYASSRTCSAGEAESLTVPAYCDAGLFGELQLTRDFAVWGKIGNLLNKTVQRIPLYAEKGIYATGGICLVF